MKIKRTLSMLLAIAVLLSFLSFPVLAGTADESLAELGILTGSGEGVTEEYLAGTATRTQAALVHLRLMGLEDEAFAFDGEETFTDAADASEFWQPMLEYLKTNPSSGWAGYPDGSFKPLDAITGQGFTKVLLTAMGYEYGLHFDWDTTMEFALSLGMTALADKAGENLTVGDLADAVYEALGTKTADARDLNLISLLVADGVISGTAAIEAGFEIEEPSLLIVNAYPSAVDEITVIMNMDIPEDASITLKRGEIGIVFNTSIDGDTAVLTGLYRFLAGTYTVTVDGESSSFTIEERAAAELVIGAETIYDSGEQDLKVGLKDQYGDNMPLSGANISVFNKATGFVFTPDTTDNTVKINVDEDTGLEAGDVVNVFVFDPVSGLSDTGEVLVMEAPYIAKLEIGDVTVGKLDGETPSKLYEGTKGTTLDVTAYDQYENEYTLTQTNIQTGETYTNKVQILSSNESVISAGAVTVEDGDLVFDTPDAGNAALTLIIPDRGFVATSEIITVYSLPVLTSVEIAGQTDAAYADETAKFAITGIDQYGEPMTVSQGTRDVTFTTTVDLKTQISVGSDDTVYFTAEDDGTTTIYYFCKGVFQGTFTVTVNPAAYPMQIVGIDGVPGAMATDAEAYIDLDDFNIIDQYGRTVDLTNDFPDWGIWMWTGEEADNIGIDNMSFRILSREPVPFYDFYLYTLDDLGTDTIYAGLIEPVEEPEFNTFTIKKAIMPEPVETSLYKFDVEHVSPDDIYSYSMDVVDDTIMSDGEQWNTYSQLDLYNFRYSGGLYFGPGVLSVDPFPAEDDFYPYDSPILIKAFLEDGTEVALDNYGDSCLPSIIDLVTFSIEGVDFDCWTRPDYPGSPTVWSEYESEGSCSAKAWIQGEMIAETSFELSPEAPAVASITADCNEMDESAFMDYFDGIFNPEEPETPAEMEEYMEKYYRFWFFEEFYYYEEGIPEGFFDEYDMDEFVVFIASLFDIRDQYGVELFWVDLVLAGEIRIIESTRETDAGTDYYLTIMTNNGMIHDTVRLVATDVRIHK